MCIVNIAELLSVVKMNFISAVPVKLEYIHKSYEYVVNRKNNIDSFQLLPCMIVAKLI